MSKQNEIALLVPGAQGWEVWTQGQDGRYVRTAEGGPLQAGGLEGLPGGDLAMLFPVRSFQALPFRAASTDESLFEDLATMHAERLGIRTDPMAGQLSDTFVVGGEEEATVLLHVALKSPSEGDLPLRTPKEFDLSPRAFPVDGDAIAAWKELGRWVFAVYSGGRLVYCQATSSRDSAPDDTFLREIHLALGQLAIQGLRVVPKAVHVWPPEGELGEAGTLAEGLGVKATVSRRPDPVLPEPPSKLLPADVRAARRARKKRNQQIGLGAVGVAAVLALLGWVGFDLFKDMRTRKRLNAEAEQYRGIAEAYAAHQSRWGELGPVVETERSPLEVMLAVANSIPRSSGLRFNIADIKVGGVPDGGGGYIPGEVRLTGAAQTSAPISTLAVALKRNPSLAWLEWSNAAPNNTAKGWEFVITAEELQ